MREHARYKIAHLLALRRSGKLDAVFAKHAACLSRYYRASRRFVTNVSSRTREQLTDWHTHSVVDAEERTVNIASQVSDMRGEGKEAEGELQPRPASADALNHSLNSDSSLDDAHQLSFKSTDNIQKTVHQAVSFFLLRSISLLR